MRTFGDYYRIYSNCKTLEEAFTASSDDDLDIEISDDPKVAKLQDLDRAIDTDGNDISIDDADIIIDPDGRPIDMRVVRAYVGLAVDGLVTMIDKTLVSYFNYINIFYTWQVRTFATSSTCLFINPSFLMNIFDKGDIPYIGYLLLHECYHVILGHTEDKKYKECIII